MDPMKKAAQAVLVAASAAAATSAKANTLAQEAARQTIYLTGGNFPHVAALVSAANATYLAALKVQIVYEEAKLAAEQYA